MLNVFIFHLWTKSLFLSPVFFTKVSATCNNPKLFHLASQFLQTCFLRTFPGFRPVTSTVHNSCSSIQAWVPAWKVEGMKGGFFFYWTSPGFQTLSDSQTSSVELFPFSSNSVSPVVSILEQIAAGEWKTKSGRNMQTNNKRHKAKAQQSKYY